VVQLKGAPNAGGGNRGEGGGGLAAGAVGAHGRDGARVRGSGRRAEPLAALRPCCSEAFVFGAATTRNAAKAAVVKGSSRLRLRLRVFSS
jgi:hypothetical protein